MIKPHDANRVAFFLVRPQSAESRSQAYALLSLHSVDTNRHACSLSSCAAWLQAVIVMVVVAFIAFLLFQYVGDPVVFLLGQDAKPEQIRATAGRPGPRPALLRAVLALPGQRGAGRVRPEPAPGRQGFAPDRRALPATLELSLVAALLALADRHPDGRLCGAAARHLHEPVADDVVAARRVAADLPDRHPADPGVRRAARLVARASGAATPVKLRRLEHRPADASTAGCTSSCRR